LGAVATVVAVVVDEGGLALGRRAGAAAADIANVGIVQFADL
jgi:hypothetical protein